MYSFKSRVRYSEVNYNKTMKLNSIIDYFQDCSIFQSEDLGIGLDYLTKSNRAWILSSWQIVINKYPVLNDEIEISTWAYDFKGIYGYRNFMMRNAKQEVLAYANSIWVYIDTKTGLPTKIDKYMGTRYDTKKKFDMDYAPRKIAIPDNLETLKPFPVVRANIDTNKHVNNGQYVLMAQQFLPNNYKVNQLRADYRKAAKLGDIITPMISNVDGVYTVVLANSDGNPYTTLEFK